MSEYLHCPRCGSRIINRLQYYELCACQIHNLLNEEPASEREVRWLHQARRLNNAMRFAEGKAIVQAILQDNPKCKEAQEMLWQYQNQNQ